jgi:hypothetical protein
LGWKGEIVTFHTTGEARIKPIFPKKLTKRQVNVLFRIHITDQRMSEGLYTTNRDIKILLEPASPEKYAGDFVTPEMMAQAQKFTNVEKLFISWQNALMVLRK